MYLVADRPVDSDRERTDVASAQVVFLPLVAEELELSFLLLVQPVAITHLNNTTSTSGIIIKTKMVITTEITM